MFVPTLVAAVSAALMVSAQTVIPVHVGGNATSPALKFDPPSVTANQNDIVQFIFSGVPGNHSVTQSSFTKPCEAIPGGFDSGWVFNADPTAPAPTWNLTITNATAPIWFYCKQLKSTPGQPHCNLEMVGVINIGTKSLDAYLSAASADPTVDQTEGPLSAAAAFATAAPDVTGPSQSLLNPFATLTAPGSGASGGSSGGSSGSSSAPPSTKSGGALVNGMSSLTAFAGALFGMVLAL